MSGQERGVAPPPPPKKDSFQNRGIPSLPVRSGETKKGTAVEKESKQKKDDKKASEPYPGYYDDSSDDSDVGSEQDYSDSSDDDYDYTIGKKPDAKSSRSVAASKSKKALSGSMSKNTRSKTSSNFKKKNKEDGAVVLSHRSLAPNSSAPPAPVTKPIFTYSTKKTLFGDEDEAPRAPEKPVLTDSVVKGMFDKKSGDFIVKSMEVSSDDEDLKYNKQQTRPLPSLKRSKSSNNTKLGSVKKSFKKSKRHVSRAFGTTLKRMKKSGQKIHRIRKGLQRQASNVKKEESESKDEDEAEAEV